MDYLEIKKLRGPAAGAIRCQKDGGSNPPLIAI